MDFASYLLQLNWSSIDTIKCLWCLRTGRHARDERARDVLEFIVEEQPALSMVLDAFVSAAESNAGSDKFSREERDYLDRIEKARAFELAELVRLELSMLTDFYMRHMQWDKVAHYAVEEEEKSATGPHKLSALAKLLTAHMAKLDYIRAAIVADKIEKTFHVDSEADDEDFCIRRKESCQYVEEMVFFMLVLAIVRGRTGEDFFCRLSRAFPLAEFRSINAADVAGYDFVFALHFGGLPGRSTWSLFSTLEDSSQLPDFVMSDPWLSSVPRLCEATSERLKALLHERLLNMDSCSDQQTREYLLTMLQQERR